MPVIVVTASPLADDAADLRAIGDLAAAVAQALSLRNEDVHVSLVPARLGVLGRASVGPWPVVIIYGSRRPLLQVALAAAKAAAATGWNSAADSVWVQWVVTEPPS